MAENIGKIVVSIEAEVAELRRGLAQAEAEFKKSADKIVNQQKSLSSKIGKSWTEFSNKLNVVSMAANIAMKAWNTLDGVLNVVTDSTLDASQKITGSMDAIEKAGIPVVSQFLAIGRGIHDWVSGERALRKAADQARASVERQWRAGLKQLEIETAGRKKLSDFTSDILKSYGDIENMNMEANDAEKLKLKQLRERTTLEDAYAKLVKDNFRNATKEFMIGEEDKFLTAMQYLKQIQSRETDSFNELQDEKEKALEDEFQRNKRRAEEIEARNKAVADRITERAEADAERIVQKTMSLEEQLNIMKAKQDGDLEKARILAIDARYRKMSIGATKAQQESIDAMKEIELAGISAGGATPASGGRGRGGTATISTAVGGFTVASGKTETKKQTSLLKVIADATKKMSQATSNNSVVIELPQ
jgi:hypothetical protein